MAQFSKNSFFVTSVELKHVFSCEISRSRLRMRALVLEVYLLQRSLFYRLFRM